MIKNKVYYIHAREQDPVTGQFNHLGGVTIAWKVDDEGNIVVGQAARCREDERFVKSYGRDQALENLENKPAYFYIPKQNLRNVAASAGIVVMNFPTLTPFARAELTEKFCELTYDQDLTEVMGSNWYEEQVRTRLMFGDNRVEYRPEADVEDFRLYAKSCQVALDNANLAVKSNAFKARTAAKQAIAAASAV
jgi:hypothetical protein